MDTAASSFISPIGRQLGRRRPSLTADRLARRTRQRRQIQAMIAGCLLLDGLVLLIYADAGTVPFALAPAYTFCGLALAALYVLLSELGFHERFRDHYLVAPQTAVNMVSLLAFTYF